MSKIYGFRLIKKFKEVKRVEILVMYFRRDRERKQLKSK